LCKISIKRKSPTRLTFEKLQKGKKERARERERERDDFVGVA
jgi:hypothetical protein